MLSLPMEVRSIWCARRGWGSWICSLWRSLEGQDLTSVFSYLMGGCRNGRWSQIVLRGAQLKGEWQGTQVTLRKIQSRY